MLTKVGKSRKLEDAKVGEAELRAAAQFRSVRRPRPKLAVACHSAEGQA